MNSVALLIGGNQGNRHDLIAQATELIRKRIGLVVALSAVYETEPWGDFDTVNEGAKPLNFLNRALLVETPLSAHEVLREALAIEAALGRERHGAPASDATSSHRLYHSRTMDIDIIFFNDEVIDTPDLSVPHPRMHQRRFVLEPLAEIMPDYRHPLMGKSVKEMIEECEEPPKGVNRTQAGVITPENGEIMINEPRRG